MKTLIPVSVLFLALPLAAAERVTFTEHIAPMVFKSCSGCHRPGEGAPFPLLNYRDVSKRAKLIARVTEDHVMPPWHAVEGDFDFTGDRRLSGRPVQLFQDWLEAGTPEGDAEKLPQLPDFPSGWQDLR